MNDFYERVEDDTTCPYGLVYTFAWKTDLTTDQREDVSNWCREQFGTISNIDSLKTARWSHNSSVTRFWFRDTIDATAFKMKWC